MQGSGGSGSVCSSPGVELAVDLFQALVVDMGINLGGGNIRMSQQFLNDPQVGSVLKQVGGEGVAKEVWINIPGKSGLTGTFLHYFSDPVRAEGAAPYGKKDFGRSVGFDESGRSLSR